MKPRSVGEFTRWVFIMRFNQAALVSTLLFLVTVCQAQTSNTQNLPEIFKKTIPIELRGGLRLVDVKSRCDGCAPWRFIDYFSSTSNEPIKQEKISVQEGYRAMYSYPGTDYFSNTKIEQSTQGQYQNDKGKVIDAIKHDYKTNSERVARYLKENKDYRDKVEPLLIVGKEFISLEEEKYKGYEYISITDSVIGLTGGTISQIHIFIPKSEIIVTAYLLWQKNAKFRTMDEFLRLRREFIEGLRFNSEVQL